MTYRRIVVIAIIVAVVCVAGSYISFSPEKFGLCSANDQNCADYYFYGRGITTPIFIFALPYLILLAVSFFVRKEAFYAWIKFAIPWTIFSGLLVAQIPQYGGGGLDVGIGPSRGGIIIFLAGVLLVISLIIIFVKGRKVREGNQ